ncbi:MAG: glycosyl transferase family 2 [Colwellia sp.]|jgi:cellulose synthase/poly-beta-1,6-N-acetylglucosamine synthase-like glycosyltransferase|nr:MAG: glycosyl transferase family 2 [Colwellia sp.]
MVNVFWFSLAVIVYSYFVYPLILIIFSAVKQAVSDTHYLWKKSQRRVVDRDNFPPVSIIIAAYNEESCIKARIENLLSLDYPQDKLTIHIGSDGSKDKTAKILTSFDEVNLKVHIFEENRGKMSVINDLVEQVDSDYIVFSDANTHFNKNTIECLVRHFNHDDIGAVCGELHLIDVDSGDNKDNIYWNYEQVLKFHEARLNALQGANGAVYAIRKELFIPLPANTIVDDFQIAMNIAKQGSRLIYDPEAIAIEEIAPNLQAEEGRRIRIGLGNYQALFTMTWALNPLLGWRFIAYFSHKVCRWFVPHLMLIILMSNLLLINNPLYQLLFIGQVLFYSIAFYGINKQKKQQKVNSITGIITFFVSMNIALMRGFIRYFSSNVQGTWERTTR